MKQLLAFTGALVDTIALLLLVTAWSFAWLDLILLFLLAIGAGVGWWARGVWERQ